MKNVIELIKERREAAKEAGFSLLELVVAVGILLVLTVGGLLAYNGITENARKAAVESAASEVFTAASAYEADNEVGTTATQAAKEWNETRGDDTTITVQAGTNEEGEVGVSVSHTGTDHVATKGASDATLSTGLPAGE